MLGKYIQLCTIYIYIYIYIYILLLPLDLLLDLLNLIIDMQDNDMMIPDERARKSTTVMVAMTATIILL